MTRPPGASGRSRAALGDASVPGYAMSASIPTAQSRRRCQPRPATSPRRHDAGLACPQRADPEFTHQHLGDVDKAIVQDPPLIRRRSLSPQKSATALARTTADLVPLHIAHPDFRRTRSHPR
jgi:hypothetical protein